MKAIVLTCDRCGAVVEEYWKTHITEEFRPAAIRDGVGPRGRPEGWRELADDERIEDVCPDCLTVVERAEAIVACADVPF